MKKKNKDGFTLVELLATLIILAIIGLITIPLVLSVIKDTNINSLKISSKAIIKAAELYMSDKNLDSIFKLDINELEYKGVKPEKGYITIDDSQKIEMVYIDNKYCVIKEKANSDIEVIGKNDGNYFCSEDNLNKIIHEELNMCTENLIIPEDSCFKIDSDGNISKYLCKYTNIKVPNVIDGSEIFSIGESAFADKKIKCLEISEGIKEIGTSAFRDNAIESLKLPKSIKYIGESAFRSAGLKQVVLPNGLLEIDNNAFYYNKIEYVYLPDSLIKMGDQIFNNNAITEIYIPNSFKLNNLSAATFRYNTMKKMTIPHIVTKLSDNAFFKSGLEEINIHTKLSFNKTVFDSNLNLKIVNVYGDNCKEFAKEISTLFTSNPEINCMKK